MEEFSLARAGVEEPRPSRPHATLLSETRRRVRDFYDALGPERERWIARNRYYYDALARLVRFIVPPGQRVLDIGCGNGDLLAAVRPSHGVGVDLSGAMRDLAQKKHPELEVHQQAAEELS